MGLTMKDLLQMKKATVASEETVIGIALPITLIGLWHVIQTSPVPGPLNQALNSSLPRLKLVLSIIL